jgi:hypothetical protein
VAIVILIGNVPLSAAYFAIYSAIASRYTVRLVNATSATITGVVITDPAGKQLKLPGVPPGQTVQGWFCPGGEGAITLSAPSLAQPVEVDGYVSDGLPGGPRTRTVIVGPNGTVTVK